MQGDTSPLVPLPGRGGEGWMRRSRRFAWPAFVWLCQDSFGDGCGGPEPEFEGASDGGRRVHIYVRELLRKFGLEAFRVFGGGSAFNRSQGRSHGRGKGRGGEKSGHGVKVLAVGRVRIRRRRHSREIDIEYVEEPGEALVADSLQDGRPSELSKCVHWFGLDARAGWTGGRVDLAGVLEIGLFLGMTYWLLERINGASFCGSVALWGRLGEGGRALTGQLARTAKSGQAGHLSLRR